MKIYCRPRRGGKTYELVENELLGKNAILLVMNEREKVRIIKNHGLSIKAAKKILTWDNIHVLMGQRFKGGPSMKFFKRKTPAKNDRKSVSCDVTVSDKHGFVLIKLDLELYKSGDKWATDKPFTTRGLKTGKVYWVEMKFYCIGGEYLIFGASAADYLCFLSPYIGKGQKITTDRFSVDFSDLVNF